jgi:hypothetical protein
MRAVKLILVSAHLTNCRSFTAHLTNRGFVFEECLFMCIRCVQSHLDGCRVILTKSFPDSFAEADFRPLSPSVHKGCHVRKKESLNTQLVFRVPALIHRRQI